MNGWDRREFAKLFTLMCCGCTTAQNPSKVNESISQSLDVINPDHFIPTVAKYWDQMPGKKVKCKLCPHECEVADLERGTCGVRENRDGKYQTLVYSRVCAIHVDPIEKKPLYHYLPGSTAFSIATPGCNMECQYCQNWEISQFRPEQIQCVSLSPQNAASIAKRSGTPTIAYTYSEPVVFYEYMYDTAVAAKANGIGNVMISNGFIQKEPLQKLISVLSAIKIDFKGFSSEFYQKMCKGQLKPVLDSLILIAQSNIWFELVILIIPTLNDSKEENIAMFKWIRNNLGDSIPIHLTRFHPIYKLNNLPPTPVSTLERLFTDAKNVGLKFVYIGNVPGHEGENTLCPSCNTRLIRRGGFQILENIISKGKCPKCKISVPGVFSK